MEITITSLMNIKAIRQQLINQAVQHSVNNPETTLREIGALYGLSEALLSHHCRAAGIVRPKGGYRNPMRNRKESSHE